MINSNQASASVTFNFIQPVKLDRSNYLVWKAQVRASIIANVDLKALLLVIVFVQIDIST